MKIKKIHIEKFRGIPTEIDINTTDCQGIPVSTVIYGDNGCGKSSIVDAIEFNTQGLIEHSEAIQNPTRPSALSYQVQNREVMLPTTKLYFDDGSVFERKVTCDIQIKEKNGELIRKVKYGMTPTQPINCFNLSSFVFRRNDLYRFISAPDEQKQVLLWKYFFIRAQKDFNEPGEVEDKIQQEKYIELKQRRREYIKSLAEELGVSVEQIPIDPKSFDNFVANSGRFYKPRKFFPKNSKAYQTQTAIPLKYMATHELEILIKSVNREISTINKEKAARKSEIPSIPVSINPYLEKASMYLSSAFKQISNVDFVSSIEVHIGTQSVTSLSVIVILKNGRKTSPQTIFSEANQDLLILLLYVSIFRVAQESGQSNILVLDDILQSIDATIRTKFVDYLLRELKTTQFIITAHDKLWLNQLRVLFQRHSHRLKEYHILNWDFQNGPNLIEVNFPKGDESLSKAIETNNPLIIASITGVFLERICQKLSVHLSISLHRKSDDKYTLGELWPGIFKILKKTHLHDEAETINHLLFIRNFIGCHYNEWAEGLSDKEILSFATSVQKLYEGVFCTECLSWLTKSEKSYKCTCGLLSF